MIKSVIRYLGIIAIVILSSCAPKGEQTNAIVLQTLSAQPTFLREPYTTDIEIEEIVLSGQKTVYRNGPRKAGGVSWVAGQVDAGSPKKQINEYTVVYDLAGNELSRTLNLDKVEVIEASPRVYEYGAKPVKDAVFFPSKIYRYGANCRGCRPNADGIANTASGIGISAKPAVRQFNGALMDGIKYEGYYVMASDRAIPMCSIIEVSNHKFSGSGLKPGVPFKAIILDRGVSGRVLDLFVGDEATLNDSVRLLGTQYPKVKLIGRGRLARNANGQRGCIVD
ncbi:MAG: hypothetical protein GX845_00390 [Erysipelothrix sp.]|jgi:hypothetical protein|nr:hypothetical protein [Erysipelothrix sp.]